MTERFTYLWNDPIRKFRNAICTIPQGKYVFFILKWNETQTSHVFSEWRRPRRLNSTSFSNSLLWTSSSWQLSQNMWCHRGEASSIGYVRRVKLFLGVAATKHKMNKMLVPFWNHALEPTFWATTAYIRNIPSWKKYPMHAPPDQNVIQLNQIQLHVSITTLQ